MFRLTGARDYPPNRGHRISGLRLLLGDDEVARIDVGDPMDNSAVFRLVSDSAKSLFLPGSRYEYSNTGYMALASLADDGLRAS